MSKVLAVGLAAMVSVVVLLGGCVALIGGAATGSSAGLAPGTPGSDAGPAVPAAWEVLDQSAAATCPGLAWSVLAAIGRVESDSGRSNLPGVHSGANSAGAEGPMQFEPATFAEYATVGPGGVRPASPYDPVDAVYTAATMLCADGGGHSATLNAAVGDYNHSAVYVQTVLVLSEALLTTPTLPATGATALAFATAQLGVPYLWGGTGDGGYDCSGLVQAAYRAAGIDLPRVAQDQFDAGPAVPDGSTVEPGDLVFFGTSAASVEHVGLYVGGGEMIDAPYTGTVVRFDRAGQPDLVGATRPD